MSHIVRTAQAELDLYEIWSYIAEDNPRAADRLLDEIGNAFQLLSDFPETGRYRDEFSQALRSFPVQRYVIYYQPFEGGIRILRVLHGARDQKPL
ncbi:MAG: type II toxin-antitoxin system RelE/ParE family toxin [Armatimonadetes bacterium]|nr:type II toxin-antitoxin system RelE/ParE family toxin [Armatimonadota bacterium]